METGYYLVYDFLLRIQTATLVFFHILLIFECLLFVLSSSMISILKPRAIKILEAYIYSRDLLTTTKIIIAFYFQARETKQT